MENRKYFIYLSMDTFFSTNNAVLRLYREWEKHKKLVIACDFDETVFDTHDRKTEHDMIIKLLKKCNELDFYVVIFTASKVSRYDFIRDHMKGLGIKIHGINENAIELPYGKNGKIYANIFLDDRAGLGQAYTTLSSVIEMIKMADAIENGDGEPQKNIKFPEGNEQGQG